jgi:hypothetical protein
LISVTVAIRGDLAVLESLRSAVVEHAGEFLCSEIHAEKISKTVKFRHVAADPAEKPDLPEVPGLSSFYSTFGSLVMYLDDESGESAFYIAQPSQWDILKADFGGWLEGMDDEELDECVPPWVADCLVVGEVPRSGNYLLVPSAGPEAGKVYEFEHDGFEFIELGQSLQSFVERALTPDWRQLTGMASHLRFVVGDRSRQWWIREMRDNRGNVVKTRT